MIILRIRAFIRNSDFIDIFDITHGGKLNLFKNKHIECLFQYAYAAVYQHWLARDGSKQLSVMNSLYLSLTWHCHLPLAIHSEVCRLLNCLSL